MKSVLVTGGAGFIGSHLVDALISEGTRVVVIDDLSTGRAERVNPAATLEVADLSDPAVFARLAAAVQPQAIYHLGAQSSVTVSVSDPARDCRVNVQGTLNVAEAARVHQCPVIFSSTGGALYGNEAPTPTPETFPPAPQAPYGASKWAGEAYLNTWANAHGLPHAICRLGNVYGPRQSPHGEAGVISIFSYRLWQRESASVFGFGKPTRDYIHVSDVVVALMRAEGVRGTFNLATGQETSTGDIYRLVAEVAGQDITPELLPLRTGELEQSCLDPSAAEQALSWRAKTGVEDGVAATYHALVDEWQAATASPVQG
jgi:UDP-glucose 4-epimerase